jgi:hypothetical protein
MVERMAVSAIVASEQAPARTGRTPAGTAGGAGAPWRDLPIAAAGSVHYG